MTKKEYEEVKIRLNRYRELRGKVERLAEEAARWNSIAELSASELRRSGGGRSGHRDMGALKSSALSIEEERDRAAKDAMTERQHLMEVIFRIKDSSSREILEQVYIGGSTIPEIAAAQRVSEKTVRRRLHRATELAGNEINLSKN